MYPCLYIFMRFTAQCNDIYLQLSKKIARIAAESTHKETKKGLRFGFSFFGIEPQDKAR